MDTLQIRCVYARKSQLRRRRGAYHTKSTVDSVQGLLTALINTDIETIEETRMSPEDVKRSVMINTGDAVSTNFDMNRGEIKKLIDIGYESTKMFLNSA